MRIWVVVFFILFACHSTSSPQTIVKENPTMKASKKVPLAQVRVQASEAYKAKQWSQCATLYVQGEDFYNAACCYSLAGEIDQAFLQLETLLSQGFKNKEVLSKDTDFTPLQSDPRWVSILSRAQANLDAYLATINKELYEIFIADQADRMVGDATKIDWKVVGARDKARQEKVQEILDQGGAKVADDLYHAAMVFQHGTTVEDSKKAHTLALEAVKKDPDHQSAKWLAAASKDRSLMRQGKPQWYGTQFHTNEEGKWILYEVDPSITDKERANWNVPPLSVAKKRAAQMNQTQ